MFERRDKDMRAAAKNRLPGKWRYDDEAEPEIHHSVKIGHYALVEIGARIAENVVVGPYTHIMPGTRIARGAYVEGCYLEGCVVGENTKIYRNAHIMAATVIGRDCLIGHGCFIADGDIVGDRVRMMLNAGIGRHTTIGDDVYIGPNVVFSNGDHQEHNKRVTIGEGAWIGTNAVTTAGVCIGAHAVVGAGSVVTKDVPDYSVVCGNPAKLLRWNTSSGLSPAIEAEANRHLPRP